MVCREFPGVILTFFTMVGMKKESNMETAWFSLFSGQWLETAVAQGTWMCRKKCDSVTMQCKYRILPNKHACLNKHALDFYFDWLYLRNYLTNLNHFFCSWNWGIEGSTLQMSLISDKDEGSFSASALSAFIWWNTVVSTKCAFDDHWESQEFAMLNRLTRCNECYWKIRTTLPKCGQKTGHRPIFQSGNGDGCLFMHSLETVHSYGIKWYTLLWNVMLLHSVQSGTHPRFNTCYVMQMTMVFSANRSPGDTYK